MFISFSFHLLYHLTTPAMNLKISNILTYHPAMVESILILLSIISSNASSGSGTQNLPSALLLQGEEVPFQLELIGKTGILY